MFFKNESKVQLFILLQVCRATEEEGGLRKSRAFLQMYCHASLVLYLLPSNCLLGLIKTRLCSLFIVIVSAGNLGKGCCQRYSACNLVAIRSFVIC